MPGLAPFGEVIQVPPEFWDLALPRKTNIVMAESLAVVIGWRATKQYIGGCSLLCFIDNLAALSGFVNGHSQVHDLSSIYAGAGVAARAFGLAPWFEYVPSPSNIADGGSRIGIADPVARLAGISLSPAEFPTTWPSLWSFRASEWAAFFRINE